MFIFQLDRLILWCLSVEVSLVGRYSKPRCAACASIFIEIYPWAHGFAKSVYVVLLFTHGHHCLSHLLGSRFSGVMFSALEVTYFQSLAMPTDATDGRLQYLTSSEGAPWSFA